METVMKAPVVYVIAAAVAWQMLFISMLILPPLVKLHLRRSLSQVFNHSKIMLECMQKIQSPRTGQEMHFQYCHMLNACWCKTFLVKDV